jgi:hypothetical protein
VPLNETYSRVQLGKHLSDTFPINKALNQRSALSLLLLNYALEYAMRRVQANQDGFKINGTHLLPVYADYLNTLDESTHNIYKIKEVVLVAGHEIVREF